MHSIINKIKKQTGSSLGSNRTPSDGPTSSLKRIRCVCSTDICHMGYGTYPRATRLQDGSLLGTHTAFYNSENIIVTTKSTDDGMSWNPFGEVTRGVGDIDNPFLIQLQNGNVLCAFRNHSKNLDGSYLHHRITVCVSEDGGKAWKYLSTPEESAEPIKGLWEPFLRIGKDGFLQLYYSRENASNDQDSIQRISRDGGASWGKAIAFSGHGIVARDGMLGLADYGNKLVAVFETNEGGPMHIKSVTSPDDGKTWHSRQLVYRASSGVAAAPQIANCGGALIVTFQTDEDGSEPCMKCMAGSPGNWHGKTLLSPAESRWGGIMTLDDSNALVMFDNGGCKTRKICVQR